MFFKQLSSFVARYETAEGDDFNINQAVLKQKRENFEGQMYTMRTSEVTAANQTKISGNKWSGSKVAFCHIMRRLKHGSDSLNAFFFFVFKESG